MDKAPEDVRGPVSEQAEKAAETRRGLKGVAGLVIIAIVVFSSGMQVQSWLNGEERAALRRQYTEDLQQARADYDLNAKNRTNIVDEVSRVSAETLRIQKETLDLVRALAPQTAELAKTAKRIDRKSGLAAREAKKARVAADQAADAASDITDTKSINAKIRAANRRAE